MTRPNLIHGLFVVAIVAYPFLVFFGIRHFPPSYFGLALLGVLGLRLGVLAPTERPVLLPILLGLGAYAAVAAVLQNRTMLLFYPALVNLFLCAVFLISLLHGDPLLLRLIKARGWQVSSHGPRYLYRLTAVWAGFFLLNAAISAWTCSRSLEVWALYNGFLAYILIAILGGGEWLFRQYYRRRMGV